MIDPNDSEDKKADFSDVESGSSSTAPAPASPKDSGSDAQTSSTRRIYVVERGDSLSRIAKKFYGDAGSWKRIFEANRERISDPDLIQPGWKLYIPE